MRLIYGHGYNDADYPINWTENGNRMRCPIYSRWKSMMHRTADHELYPFISAESYEFAEVDTPWVFFSNFSQWAKNKYRPGYHLDKDLLVEGNTLYSPDTCCFLPPRINSAFKPNSKVSPIGRGVRMKTSLGGCIYYEAYTADFATVKWKSLGCYKTVEDAHKTWQLSRIANLNSCIEYLYDLDFQDERVFTAINNRINCVKQNIKDGVQTT